jgi:glycosyltransferase involved in cell wall biosynthesis
VADPTGARNGHDGSVTIAIASLNTRRFTELAVRTAVVRAGCTVRVVIGDSGSTDGTLAMLERLGSRYLDRVERAPSGRTHGEWLDHWIATLDGEFVVFVDSDVEFRRRDWLVRLLAQQEHDNAAIVAAEWVEEIPFFVEPLGLVTVRLMGRPAPWLQLVHLPTVRSLAGSYGFHAEATSEVPEGWRAYDVGGLLSQLAQDAGHRISVMPPAFRAQYRHYGGRSWSARGKRARFASWIAGARLTRFRALHW